MVEELPAFTEENPSSTTLTKLSQRVRELATKVLATRDTYTYSLAPYHLGPVDEHIEYIPLHTPEEHPSYHITDARLALLDVTMLESALNTLGKKPPEQLKTISNILAHVESSPLRTSPEDEVERPPTLTYEDVVLPNPFNEDPRTFSRKATGTSELYFYRVHAHIERICAVCMDRIVDLLHASLKETSIPPTSLRERIIPLVLEVTKSMQDLLRELPPEDFTKMRPFFAPNTDRGTPGPSGKFSAGLFVLDALSCGSNPHMQKFLEGKMKELQFFPRTSIHNDGFPGQHDMHYALFQAQVGNTLLDRCSAPSDSREAFCELLESIRTMRKMHFGLVAKFVPDALTGGAQGTGGESNVQAYLMHARSLYEDILSSLRSSK